MGVKKTQNLLLCSSALREARTECAIHSSDMLQSQRGISSDLGTAGILNLSGI